MKDSFFKRIEEKIDSFEKKFDEKFGKIDQRLDDIDKTLIKQEENLKLHMYRTDLAEKNLEVLSNRIAPVEKHIMYVNGAFKLIVGLGIISGLVLTLIQIFSNK